MTRTICKAAHTFDNAAVLLAAHRLLDTLAARPRSLAEFKDAETRAHDGALSRPCRAGRASLRVMARLRRALRGAGIGQAASLRLAAEVVALPRQCEKNACRKAQTCRAKPRDCLRRAAPRVPEAVRTAIVELADRIERGDTLELAVALLPFENKMALRAWQRRRMPCSA